MSRNVITIHNPEYTSKIVAHNYFRFTVSYVPDMNALSPSQCLVSSSELIKIMPSILISLVVYQTAIAGCGGKGER